jgi:two-component system, NarL family, response regulator NreC
MGVRILLADDHPIVRQGMRSLVETQKDLMVVGEASDGLQAVQLVEKIKPDILILDLMMPSLNGMEVLRHIQESTPETRVIVLSMHSADSYVIKAMQNGASGYIVKETGPSELIQAIRNILAGEIYLSPILTVRQDAIFVETGDKTLKDPYDLLTRREVEILQMTAEGRSSNDIGGKLSISPRTVEIHRSRLMKKLALRNQSELIRYALKRGLMDLDG